MPDPLEALLRIRCENDLVLRLQAIVEDQYSQDRKSRSVSAFARDALWERVLAEEKARGIGPAGNASLNEAAREGDSGDKTISAGRLTGETLVQQMAREKLAEQKPRKPPGRGARLRRS
jgi:hypothetical protein